MKYHIGFLTQHEKKRLEEIIRESIESWCTEWINYNAPIFVELEQQYSLVDDGLIDQDGFYCLDGSDKLGFLTNSVDIWVKLLFKNIEKLIPNDTISLFLIENSRRDILLKIFNICGKNYVGNKLVNIKDVDFEGMPVVANILVGHERFRLLLDSNILNNEQMYDLSSSTPISIASFDDEIVALEAKFVLDKLSISDFMDIQVGDIIKSNHHITEFFSIVCNGDEIALGSLGQKDAQRAILLTSNNEIKK
ncbi:FliM/FliN family flagellar motor C-terminal domain-containing protein [Acinetobacter sp. 3657]|uniref:FliM/FliN family flagellar motor C-terminal domain-containing protein n=1 Tax=Acinetobacter sp. 3657 TaxID=2817764 RepID=UPI002858490B|nr:hypothetical protein [Prolinoborus sp. 3657]